MSLLELFEMMATLSKEAIFARIDALVAQAPDLADKGAQAKAFLNGIYSVQNIAGGVGKAASEVLALIQAGEGPVDPDIGDTA